MTRSTTARAHPNIALVKYWGKQVREGNYPATANLSITLGELATTTTISTLPSAEPDQIRLNGVQVSDTKISTLVASMRAQYALSPLAIASRNNFPTAAGLASSASGFAALVTAIDHHCQLHLTTSQKVDWARRGSGSAARSLFGGFVGVTGPDWLAEPLINSQDWPLEVVVAIASDAAKVTSSSDGMERSRLTSPYYPPWVASAADDYRQALRAIHARDFQQLATTAEHSCLKMQGLMLSSQPPLVYWQAATVECLHRIQALRAQGVPVFFTNDAGPQVKAVCLPGAAAEVQAALASVPGITRTLTCPLGEGAHIVSEPAVDSFADKNG